MKVVFKNPEVKYVSLRDLGNGMFFKIRGKSTLYLKLRSEGARIMTYNTEYNCVDYFTDEVLVHPYEDVQIVITTPGGAK